MKKIIYSGFLKFTAIILTLACVLAGAVIAVDVFSGFESEQDIVYRLERDFSHSRIFFPYYYDAQFALLNAYRGEYYGESRENTNTQDSQTVIFRKAETLPENDGDMVMYDGQNKTDDTDFTIIRDINKTEPTVTVYSFNEQEKRAQRILKSVYAELNRNKDLENTEWYITINNFSITNSTEKRIGELINGKGYFFRFSRDASGNSESESSGADFYDTYMLDEIASLNTTDTFSVFISVKEDHVREMHALWSDQEKTVRDAFSKLMVLAVIVLSLLIYLVCTAGKGADGKTSHVWIDRVWSELHIAFSAAAVVGAAAVFAVTVEAYLYNSMPPYMLRGIFPTVCVAAMGAVTVCLLSLVRKIKCGIFLKTSLVGIIATWVFKVAKYVFCALRWARNTMFSALSRKTAVLFGTWLFVYTGVIGFCGVLIFESDAFLVIAVLLFLTELFLLSWRARDLEEIKKGVEEVYRGNYSYNVPEIKSSDLKQTASYINEISKSIDSTVAEKTKAERMKTELVTNISHDIKTPLTSIISYTELLSDMEGLPHAARDYIAIIASKSDRLKKLTADLFDISKVHSGNEHAELETLNLSLLAEQAMAELDDDIKASDLEFCVDIDKDMYISADGKKMSRVMGNLLGNILKYSMKNTRVYICAYEKDGKNVLELKNISAFPLNFDPNEITGRFVRGDLARTTEGNGLGLAIAKGYTEVCGGGFEIITDGDLFKAVISFEKVLPRG